MRSTFWESFFLFFKSIFFHWKDFCFSKKAHSVLIHPDTCLSRTHGKYSRNQKCYVTLKSGDFLKYCLVILTHLNGRDLTVSSLQWCCQLKLLGTKFIRCGCDTNFDLHWTDSGDTLLMRVTLGSFYFLSPFFLIRKNHMKKKSWRMHLWRLHPKVTSFNQLEFTDLDFGRLHHSPQKLSVVTPIYSAPFLSPNIWT